MGMMLLKVRAMATHRIKSITISRNRLTLTNVNLCDYIIIKQQVTMDNYYVYNNY